MRGGGFLERKRQWHVAVLHGPAQRRGPLWWEQVEQRLAIVRDEGIHIGDAPKPLRHPLGYARDHHAAVALAAEHPIDQILELEVANDVFDVRVERDGRRRAMYPLAETGQRGPRCLMAARA